MGYIVVRAGHWPHASAEEVLEKGHYGPIILAASIVADLNAWLAELSSCNVENDDVAAVLMACDACRDTTVCNEGWCDPEDEDSVLHANCAYNPGCFRCACGIMLNRFAARLQEAGFPATLIPSPSMCGAAIVVDYDPETIIVFDESPHDENLVYHAWIARFVDVNPVYARMLLLSKWHIVNAAVSMACPLVTNGLAELIIPVEVLESCSDWRCVITGSMFEPVDTAFEKHTEDEVIKMIRECELSGLRRV